MIEGAMRHGTTMDVEANYTDSHGQPEIGFGVTRLLNFDLLHRPRTECGRSWRRWISVATSRSTNTSWRRAPAPAAPFLTPPRAAWRRPSAPACHGTANSSLKHTR